MSPQFRATHRMLLRATVDHNYETVEIDIINGTFKRVSVKMSQTKIRVNKSILGENMTSGKPLGLDEIEAIASTFNEARVAAGYAALEFRTTEETKNGKLQ